MQIVSKELGGSVATLERWRADAETPDERASPQETRDSRKRIKELERDQRRKDSHAALNRALFRCASAIRAAIVWRSSARLILSRRRAGRSPGVFDSTNNPVVFASWLGLKCGRWNVCKHGERYSHALRPVPAHALSADERRRVVQIANESRFAELPRAWLVPMLGGRRDVHR